jgi:hypothetical protein
MVDLRVKAGSFMSSEAIAAPMPARRHGHRAPDGTGTGNITALLVAVFLIGAVVVGAIIAGAASNQDREASARSTELVQALLTSYERRLGPSVADYAWWDEAVQNLALTPSAEWADANVGISFNESFGANVVFVLDSADRMTMRFADGVSTTVTDIGRWVGGMDRIVASARAVPMDDSAPATGSITIKVEPAPTPTLTPTPLPTATAAPLALPASPTPEPKSLAG